VCRKWPPLALANAVAEAAPRGANWQLPDLDLVDALLCLYYYSPWPVGSSRDWTPQGAEILDLERERPGPPRGGRRGLAVTVTRDPPGCWRCNGGNMGQWHLFRGTPGPPRGGAKVAFGPAGSFGARGLAGPVRRPVFSVEAAGVSGGGGEKKTAILFCYPGHEITLEQTH
jgi:hypothetical protein